MTANNDPSSAGAGRAKFSRRRLVPLVVVVVASGVVIAMGWQRQLSFETLARHYEVLREFIAAHEVSAVPAYIALYIVAVALSVPVGAYLTVTGGILFGAVLGGAAAVVGATIGAICIFLIAKSAIGEYFVRRAGRLAEKVAEGFRADGIIPVTFAFAFVGAGLDSVIAAQQAAYQSCLAAGRPDCRLEFHMKAALTPELLGAFVALGILALIPVVVKRLRARATADARERTDNA